jgi:hypothetical protein
MAVAIVTPLPRWVIGAGRFRDDTVVDAPLVGHEMPWGKTGFVVWAGCGGSWHPGMRSWMMRRGAYCRQDLLRC